MKPPDAIRWYSGITIVVLLALASIGVLTVLRVAWQHRHALCS